MPQNTWGEFYSITKDRPASALLQRAIKFVQNKNSALDLGAGALKDTKFLLTEGFQSIIIVDSEPLVAEAVKELVSD